jgi:triosephosphate isomerase
MRTLWLGCGWKMNHTRSEALRYANTLKLFLEHYPTRSSIFVVPPYTVLYTVSQILADTQVLIGAQNMHWKDNGAHTGEISPLMLKDCGVRIVELGHSERRIDNNETDETVNLKTLSALRHGLQPLICVGESLAEKEAGESEAVITRQVSRAMQGVNPASLSSVILAYEPVWSIGEKGNPADAEYVNHIHQIIRSTIINTVRPNSNNPIPPILYGGSVRLDNAALYVQQPCIDGLFVGRAAWKVEGFIKIIKVIENYSQ